MKSGLLLWLLLLPGIINAQLQELEAVPIEAPDRAIPVFANYPDAAAIIIKSSIPDLQFDSNIGLVADLSEPGQGEYRLIVQPMRQTITASGSGFIQLRFNVSIAEARQVVFYEVEKVVNEVPVLFRIEPADATLYLNDAEIKVQNTQLPILIDTYNLRIEKDGFKTINQIIEISSENTFFEYRLERIDPIILTVQTEPIGATVLLDGVEIGQTASNGILQVFRFPAVHDLQVTMNGYLQQSRSIEITESGENRFNFELERNSGSLLIRVTPSDAQVRINREIVPSRTNIELTPGLYRVEISKEGYAPVTNDVQIVRGESLQRRFTLEAYSGRLQYSVTPSSARIILRDSNGNQIDSWIGLKLKNDINVGSYTAHVSLQGYQSKEHQVIISRDEITTVNIALNEERAMENNVTTSRFFTEGSHKSDVVRLQGTPDGIRKLDALDYEVWSYGYSTVKISIQTGKVIEWNNSGNLKAVMEVGNNVTTSRFFTEGSHKDDVVRLQGTPDGIRKLDALDYEVWSYGYSTVKISIQTGKVIEWNNSGNLKVE